ncbi:MAG: pyridoxal-5'-phosphate-dependent protein subunit beta [Acidobacteria bacterium]|nr:MAG: pyridoxal-5'-phosphate-dependent protein subunit beta [Acidobacteriota bacterium]
MGGMIFGPTFAEMRDPSLIPAAVREQARAARGRSLDPANLWNIGWKSEGAVPHAVLPSALTGLPAPVVVLSGGRFPTGSHKVGPAYSILVEKQLDGDCAPGAHTLVFPSTGNFGIGGAWVGPRMGYRSLVVLPEEMSAERFEKIRGYGAEILATPGSESNVKEIYDKVRELRSAPGRRILNQFEEFANYRFHFHCTAAAALEVVDALGLEVGAFVSAMGSAGTIAAGEAIKRRHPAAATVAVEPVQCPTLYNVGFGAHRIEGIGDKHVTWIHNVWATDLLVCVDDQRCLEGLQLLQEGTEALVEEGVPAEHARQWVGLFGISGVCNVLASVKAARHLGLGPRQAVVTVATDGFDRYPSVLRKLDRERGPMTEDEARRRLDIFREPEPGWLVEGTAEARRRWHNQKYFTWVEQQGKTVAELRAQEDPAFWAAHQEKAAEVDRGIRERRGEGSRAASIPDLN